MAMRSTAWPVADELHERLPRDRRSHALLLGELLWFQGGPEGRARAHVGRDGEADSNPHTAKLGTNDLF
ncbi:hypothetical protein [Amycolatopsis thermoflava]|uniref:hypothetical protein n=1 Tax=Amycolatopsis thermoflava TaxID=84480 RepID=UPI00364E0499